ncbi:transglutaminase-like domain-containing protein [Pullulanibacillus sp. KACC 23026]|uniref:transglutaminase-like domain-containing protein n=1 Tax=Pullulanibacillus sp. KACC 23026 TaxID=3028315 RepID=UPI0023B11F63|nr:transglutaminase-like domain-containing protein [Pullulanibacillus sp. KACC 23026]WEG12407.1 transglutaminase-like domain-containing protein [Pullulanibacillus sp. KACC 23026]
MRQASTHRLFSLVLYILGFLLFWEWLRPLAVISDGTDISYFVCFAAFSFFLSYMRLSFWLSFPAKLIGVAYALHILYFYHTSFFDVSWLQYFYSDFTENIAFMFGGNWVGMTSLFRSFLFFILLWVVSYLMHYWLIQARKLFLFFFVTIIYLTILDSFTMYHANAAIVRTMLIGLILIGLLRLANIQEREQTTFEKGSWPISWFLGLISLVIVSLVLGFAAPKADAQWPDPTPFITKAANGYPGSGKAEQKIGYDSDDTHLGGAFQMDNTLVFTADSRYEHYWKIETKNTYTGKGWTNVPNQSYQNLVSTKDLDSFDSLKAYESDTKTKKLTDKIHVSLANFSQLVYGGDPLSISGLSNDTLRLNTTSGKLEPEQGENLVTPHDYTVTYNYPTFSVPLLQKVTDNSKDPETIQETYLQLPDELPQRVKDLAKKITAGKTNRYDKAEAIVTYLNGTSFTYDTTDVPVPKKNQDYVDQFLFESKKGYCDNFSSSMVVMLRSLGIPARWVTGFAPGKYQETVNSTTDQYQIRESDAHSWVEVYFPGSGWVPFEPTKGYTNTYPFSYTDPSAKQASVTPAKAKTHTPDKTDVQKPNQQPKPEDHSAAPTVGTHKLFPHLKGKTVFELVSLLIIVIGGIVTFIIKTRRKWLPIIWKLRYSNRTEDSTLDIAFDKLLKLLALTGYEKKASQTLREYALEIDRVFGTYDMVKLVRQIERNRYAAASSISWVDSKEFWENMINRLRA